MHVCILRRIVKNLSNGLISRIHVYSCFIGLLRWQCLGYGRTVRMSLKLLRRMWVKLTGNENTTKRESYECLHVPQPIYCMLCSVINVQPRKYWKALLVVQRETNILMTTFWHESTGNAEKGSHQIHGRSGRCDWWGRTPYSWNMHEEPCDMLKWKIRNRIPAYIKTMAVLGTTVKQSKWCLLNTSMMYVWNKRCCWLKRW